MHKQIVDFLEKHNAIYTKQFVFRTGHSCEHALLSAQNTISTALSRKEISLLLLIDFSKAFDMVDYNILLDKLYHYSVRGVCYDWFVSYLHERKQYVSINGKNSCCQQLTYGVPQGSILGPLLFVIYINDLPLIGSSSSINFILYADDANIIITGKTLNEIITRYTLLSSKLTEWVSSNGLLLNLTKTKYMIFTGRRRKDGLDKLNLSINNVAIERVSTAKFLGVLVDDKLTWHPHIVALTKKINRNMGILFKVRGIFPTHVLKLLFNSFIQSCINYCALVWGIGSKSSLNSIFIAQKKAIRLISPSYTNSFFNKETGELPTHTKPLFKQLELPNVYTIILQNLLIFMQKVSIYSVPHAILNIFNESNDSITNTIYNNFHLPDSRLKCQNNSIFVKGPRLFNELIADFSIETTQNTHHLDFLKSTKTNKFKRCIKHLLIEIQ